MLDASKAFIHMQYSTDNDATGLNDSWDVVEIGSTTQFYYRHRASLGTRTRVVWVIENTQASGEVNNMSVEHLSWYWLAIKDM